MKKRYSAEEIVVKLREADVALGKGLRVPEVCMGLGYLRGPRQALSLEIGHKRGYPGEVVTAVGAGFLGQPGMLKLFALQMVKRSISLLAKRPVGELEFEFLEIVVCYPLLLRVE